MTDQVFASNLLAWSGQVTLVTAVAGALVVLLRMSAPGLRHAWWRTVLAVCLLLPVLQPWRTRPAVPIDETTVTAAPASTLEAESPGVPGGPEQILPTLHLPAWPAALGAGLVAGALLRLAWLGVGLVRLRRLRAAGERAAPSGQEELQNLTEAGAEVRYVGGLGQPVTFGLRRPVVLLPESLKLLPPPVQRAALAHELWHVRRRDWAWILLEECVRAALWFHPAIWYLVSRIQLSREEVVDELTVLVVPSRRSYLEALLAFADEPPLIAAAPFARRGHLFQRMLLISKEAVMSSRRIIVSSGLMAAILILTSWYATSAMPLTTPVTTAAAAGIADEARAQLPPRDHRPGQARPATSREEELQAQVAKDPSAPSSRLAYIEIAKLQEARGARSDAETTLQSARAAFPTDPLVLGTLASFYNRAGDFDRAVSIVEEAAALDPSNPQGHQRVATFYQEKVQKDRSLSPTERLSYIQKGLDATDRALTMKPDYVDAMVYKNIFLRLQANLENDPGRRAELVAAADALRNRAMELTKAQGGVAGRVSGGVPGGVAGGVSGSLREVPPPPPPPPGLETETVDGMVPVRVGGNIKAPTKIRDVRPVYPQEAKDAGVQGVVIIEATIDRTGRVREARVLRSVPLLDEAAVDAVGQWEFTPTLLNGVPVPVIMTVTVNFTLQ